MEFYLTYADKFIQVYAIIASIIGVVLSTKKLSHFWKTRHLRKVWGIKNGDNVLIICSELDDPKERQNVEPGEFIYNLKYGDIDAYFEVVITLLRLYTNIKLRVISSGEAKNTRIDLKQKLILIGGPDYNSITERLLAKGKTQFTYRVPSNQGARKVPDEMALYNQIDDVEYISESLDKDFGYFERVANPNNPDTPIIIIGGCHTIGITAAVKAFSLAESEQGEIPKIVLDNAKVVSKTIKRKEQYSILIEAEKVGQTINTPIVNTLNIFNLQA